MSETSPVTFFKSDDPEIEQASENARDTFRFFWKEVTLDYNRIVPALELACLKVPFSDDKDDPDSQVEHMWVSEVDFDGVQIHGSLINSPNWLKSVKEGDSVSFKIKEISDWFCVLGGEAYGAYSVQVIRSRMSETELASYDESWGLKFPEPSKVQIPDENEEFEKIIAEKLSDHLKGNIETIRDKDDEGRTILHLEALYGRKHGVKVLLEHGADRSVKCNRGWTPLDYAKSLGWVGVIELLEEK